MHEQAFAAILDAIYDASALPEQWKCALQLLGNAFQCNVATIIDRNIRTLQGSAVATGIDAAGQAEYFSTWTAKNVFIESTPRWAAGVIVTDQHLLPKSSLIASDYYNGFMKPRDMHSLLRLSLRVEGDVHQSISLLRPKQAGDFGEEDIAEARLLLPHLQRAASVSSYLNVSTAMLQTVNYLLEENSDAVILVDHFGAVLFANRAAREMADRKDGFILRHDRLEALGTSENREFQKLLAGAIGLVTDPLAARAGVMRFPRTSDAKDYLVTVTPIPQGEPVYTRSAPKACIKITDPTAAPPRPLAMLQYLYRLTNAETRLAELLFSGQTPEQAAGMLNIKISTARTHIAQIFRKADVRRQSELIGLITRLS